MAERGTARLMPAVYTELRRLAAAYVGHERRGGTIQATALVHEAYLRLARERAHEWHDRTHLLAIAALSMRQILVERARRRLAKKRGGDPEPITLRSGLLPKVPATAAEMLDLDAALRRLAAVAPDHARVVELRYFGGLTIDETAAATGASPATIKRQWTLARAWLRRELSASPP